MEWLNSIDLQLMGKLLIGFAIIGFISVVWIVIELLYKIVKKLMNFRFKENKMENFEDYVSEFIGDIEGIVKFELLPTYDNFTKEQRKIILRVIEKKLEEAESEIYESKGD
ncbi:hypothetical protein [Helicobacter ganmani]|uniref:hypothetical protein n=1 Tax=Helicobacter ganmani TaxID=60246 RepID=UPI003A85BBF2